MAVYFADLAVQGCHGHANGEGVTVAWSSAKTLLDRMLIHRIVMQSWDFQAAEAETITIVS